MGRSSGLRLNFRVKARSLRMIARRAISNRTGERRGLRAPMGQSLPNRSELPVVGDGVESQIDASHGRVDTGVIAKEIGSEYKYPGKPNLEVNRGGHERPTSKDIRQTLGKTLGD